MRIRKDINLNGITSRVFREEMEESKRFNDVIRRRAGKRWNEYAESDYDTNSRGGIPDVDYPTIADMRKMRAYEADLNKEEMRNKAARELAAVKKKILDASKDVYTGYRRKAKAEHPGLAPKNQATHFRNTKKK